MQSARLRVAKWWPESWEDADQPPEQTITFFSADGSLSTVGNPAVISSFSDPTPRQIIEPLPAPIDQGLCIGSVFHINATNGVDTTRRIKLLGFCHSLEYLHDKVEGTVIRRGGEIFAAERGVKSGVSEYLTMTIAMPLLFGIPPEYDHLKTAVKQGGGVLHQIQKEWWLI